MRQHHEPSIVQGLLMLVPFAGALWARIRAGKDGIK